MDNKMIPYGHHHIINDDFRAIAEVLDSDWLTGGPTVPRFETAVAKMTGAAEGVAVNSATSALHIACLSLGLGYGDLLWTTPITYVASANCARFCGAKVDFVDIDPLTYNISPSALSHKLHIAAKTNRLPKIVVPVHYAGQSCDMLAISKLASEYGFKIIEDASHAIGGEYLNQPIGNGRFSDVTVFSFHPVKIITTGEGGIVLTNQINLADRMRRLRNHGITRDEALMSHPSDGPWYYQQIELGFNYRLTDIQAALGLSQLTRLAQYVDRRRELAFKYDQLLANFPIILPYKDPKCRSAFHLYPIQIDQNRTKHTRSYVFNQLRAAGIGVNVHYIPVHTQPYYQAFGFSVGDFPEAEKYYSSTLSLPIFSSMSEDEQSLVVKALEIALS
jgi:UDP-4-amino-4,6-dideoxy-N-acetyl-beta-L-altrosamine transaminase